uniref:Uncharacterized protein n=1 Tax=Vertebrata thuyoides TaxID=2006970 RepID=A0A1Z1MAR7_9FLOR|nr:hypothetical protein [Vertebrata thuyoides]ARW63076.1 hypothetical protein [Vertebrata thuyoides]
MDNSYFIISIVNKKNIQIYYYEHKYFIKTNYYPVCFFVPFYNFEKIILLIIKYNKIRYCSTEHKIYLGKEIFKAQISFNLNQRYIQI